MSFITTPPPQQLLYGTKHLLQYPLVSNEIARGTVKQWNPTTKILKLSEEVEFKGGDNYFIRFVENNGKVSQQYSIIALAVENTQLTLKDDEIKINEANLNNLNITAESNEQGNSSSYCLYQQQTDLAEIIIREVRPRGKDKIEITAIIEDETTQQ